MGEDPGEGWGKAGSVFLAGGGGAEDSVPLFIENGGGVYGGSAGAALLVADISPIAYMDPDPYGTADTRGLDRIAGYGVFVHHRPSEVPGARMAIAPDPPSGAIAFRSG
jgi:hypothetical protein